MSALPYDLEPLFTIVAEAQLPREVIGPVPEGIRVNFRTSGGTVTGPRLRGTVSAHGGDWFTVRRDGVGLVDAKLTLLADDGALIGVSYTGVAEFGEGGYERFAKGEIPARVPLRVVARFQTAHPAHQWLNRLQCVNIGEADLERSEVRYDVYAVR